MLFLRYLSTFKIKVLFHFLIVTEFLIKNNFQTIKASLTLNN
jgi:hypothetical protein